MSIRLFAVLFCSLYAFLISASPGFAEEPRSSVRIAPETTYINEPLKPNGLPDYAAALNARMSEGITPETNAVVGLWQVLGPKLSGLRMEIDRPMSDAVGIEPLPDEGDYLVPSHQFFQHFITERAPGATPEQTEFVWNEIEKRFEQTWNEPWRRDDFQEIALWLDANDVPFAQVEAAVQRPHYFRPVVFGTNTPPEDQLLMLVLLPDVQHYRQLARMIMARAMMHIGEGELDAAIRDLTTVHRLAYQVSRGWTLVEFLVGGAISEMAARGDIALASHPELTAPQAAAYRRLLTAFGPQRSTLVEQVSVGERFIALDSTIALAAGQNIEAGMITENDQVGDVIAWLAERSLDWDTVLTVINGYYDRLSGILRETSVRTRAKQLDQLAKDLQEVRTQMLLPETRLELVTAGPQRRGDAMGHLIGSTLTRQIQYMDRWLGRYETRLTLSITALALAEYRSLHDRYPPALNELVPKFLPEVPDDPYSGEPLQYRTSDGGQSAELASLGRDRIDDRERFREEFLDEQIMDDLRVTLGSLAVPASR
ncbi:hypothetical protein [Rubinisphaera margarita]|uniref:hypothetical protein n=1 Tax=Rubinisphaera margarita TaxID=2909586 RepID=UPI001EE97707|nr:hypothetical protein [Rubinisphaera margarita]MCG6154945.1 hypothetical protein [Rubinisphaera margarita]